MDEITHVHFEITTKCNAACPMCSRNIDGGETLPNLPLTELTIDWCKSVFPASFIRQLEQWTFCGAYGDPGVAKDTKLICRWLILLNPNIEIKISTNGSMRKPEWWADLAKLLGKNGYVEWGLDGLEDTNHLYRKNTNWGVIMRNVEAYIAAGGRARWQFIPFAHNEHQVEEAEELAKKMGFEEFIVKRTKRVYQARAPQEVRIVPVLDRKTKKATHEIHPATKPETQNRMMTQGQKLIDAFGDTKTYIEKTPIRCVAQQRKEIYISADGLIYPCCWLATIYSTEDFIHHLIKWGGKDLIDPKVKGLRKVIEGPIFWQIAASWKGTNRIPKCALTCGVTRKLSLHNDYIPLT